MSKHWKKKNDMDPHIQNGQTFEKAEEVEEVEPEKFVARKFRPRFTNVEGYKLPDNSKIHTADGRVLEGRAGDFYVCLDKVHELVIEETTFRKLFLPLVEQ